MLEDIIRLLHEGKHSLVVSNGEVRTFDRRGVADLYALLREDSDFLKGASVADKVVGKAAAALMILGALRDENGCAVGKVFLLQRRRLLSNRFQRHAQVEEAAQIKNSGPSRMQRPKSPE